MMLGTIRKLLQSHKGVATSLVEVTATIAIGATLASAAVTVVSTRIQDAKVAKAQTDVQAIREAFSAFYSDTLHYPVFVSGANTGSLGESFDVVRSALGQKADLAGKATTGFEFSPGEFRNWNDDGTGTTKVVDTLENQLNLNTPQYQRREEKGGLLTGFNGPYLESVSPSDPWGNKYYVNARFLNQAKSLSAEAGAQASVVKVKVLVLSAGVNETIQTPFFAVADGSTENIEKLKRQADDIVATIR